MKKLGKILTIAIVAMMAISATGIGAFAEESPVAPIEETPLVIGTGVVYFYGNNGTSTSSLRINENKTFTVAVNSSSYEYESSFGIGVNKSGQRINFNVAGTGTGNPNSQIKISIYKNSTEALFGSKTVTVNRFGSTDINFVGFETNVVYYIVVEPVNYSAAFSAVITTSKY